jgi:sugar/nucleoside kinase (ribokinase family)
VEQAIQSALAEAEAQGVSGRDVTPFILKRVAEKTAGDSLRSNMALVERNAAVGADIAIAIAKQQMENRERIISTKTPDVPRSRVVVMGGVVIDMVAKPVAGQRLTLATSNPATCNESDGGVARNIAEVLGRLGSSPLLYSAVGKDSRGIAMLERLTEECGVSHSHHTIHTVDGANTATYLAVLNEHGDLHTACADMAVLDKIRPPPHEVLQQAEILVMDANPPVQIVHQTALFACRAGVKVFLDPTSVSKALKVSRDDILMSCLTYASPNLDELSAMADGWRSTNDDHDILAYDDELALVRPLAARVVGRMSPEGAHLLVTCGAKGVLLASKESGASDVTFQRFPASKGIVVKNATGAGDTLSGAFIHAILSGKTIPEAISIGIEAATMSLHCADKTISPLLSDPIRLASRL